MSNTSCPIADFFDSMKDEVWITEEEFQALGVQNAEDLSKEWKEAIEKDTEKEFLESTIYELFAGEKAEFIKYCQEKTTSLADTYKERMKVVDELVIE